MSRRRTTFLMVAAACVLTVTLVGSVYLANFGGAARPIVLPSSVQTGISPEPGVIGPPSLRPQFHPVEVVSENVRTILQTMNRPEEYSAVITTTWFWTGGFETKTHYWYARDGLVRLCTQGSGPPVLNVIVTPLSIYQWEENSILPYVGPPSDMTAENFGGIPTWESLLSLPEEDIISAEYGGAEGRPVLRIVTREAFYQGEYWVSLDTGLLFNAFFTDGGGNEVYRMTMGAPDLTRPGDEWFTLPNGERVE